MGRRTVALVCVALLAGACSSDDEPMCSVETEETSTTTRAVLADTFGYDRDVQYTAIVQVDASGVADEWAEAMVSDSSTVALLFLVDGSDYIHTFPTLRVDAERFSGLELENTQDRIQWTSPEDLRTEPERTINFYDDDPRLLNVSDCVVLVAAVELNGEAPREIVEILYEGELE